MRKISMLMGLVAAALAGPAAGQVLGAPTPTPAAENARARIDTRSIGDDIPMQARDPRTLAENKLAERGNGRNGEVSVAQSARARQALAYRDALDSYVGASSQRRIEALGDAEAAQAGKALAQSPKALRNALEKDLAAWGKAFGFDKATMADQRAQWLSEAMPLSASDWARRRADWFAARDAWIAEQRAWADEQAAATD
ncbi:hypothetical protein N0B51_11755 [Tsuneonella sp. YG55]|uniref:LTXXQ motif protein n=1 Tax=Tsuneonella litorea TaxID=2976475 RepID=A0A9X3ALE4_9SPHN|nr:hypothetical protein [Tsuneonella litorea]MCT2559654.1 hypothetical protein [Tsuneonella litorea]